MRAGQILWQNDLLLSLKGGDRLNPDNALEALRGRGIENLSSPHDVEAAMALEAIILEKMRPAYFIKKDKIEIKGDFDHIDLINVRKTELEAIAQSLSHQ